MAKNSSQAAIFKDQAKSAVQSLIGWVLAVIFGLVSFVGITQIKDASNISALVFSLVVTAAGILMIIKAKKRKKLIKLFRFYSQHIAGDPAKSIDLLAASISVPVEKAKNYIAEMINRGYFTDAYINLNTNNLVFRQQNQQVSYNKPNNDQLDEYIIVVCGGCGARNKIVKNTVGECEYCGSVISDRKTCNE